MDALNDSQLIGMCIYNVVIISTLGVALSLVLSEETHLVSTLIAVFLLIGTFVTQCIVFLPKVMYTETHTTTLLNTILLPVTDNNSEYSVRVVLYSGLP